MSRRGGRSSIAVTGAIAVALVAGACGGPKAPEGVPGSKIAALPATTLPSSILDLSISSEDFSGTASKAANTYVKEAGLYSMRQGDLVQATLEVLKFNGQARLDDPKFRTEVIGQIGGATPQIAQLGSDRVYFVSGIKQKISVWYRGRTLLVLSVRDDYERPRDLVRAALGLSFT